MNIKASMCVCGRGGGWGEWRQNMWLVPARTLCCAALFFVLGLSFSAINAWKVLFQRAGAYLPAQNMRVTFDQRHRAVAIGSGSNI